MHATIEQGEFDSVPGGCHISSANCGPCIAIGIFNKRTSNGYMAHDDFATAQDVLENYMRLVMGESIAGDLIVWLTGGAMASYSTNEENEDVLNNREHVINELKELGIKESQISLHWTDEDSTSELHLFTGTGKFDID